MQSAVTILQRLHQHRAWVNENLLAAAASLTEEQLQKTFAIGQGSVWKSLLHMCAAEWAWLEALLGNGDALFPGDVRGKLPGNQLGEGGIKNFAELRDRWQTLERRWQEYLTNLAPESLDDPIEKVASSTGQRFTIRRADILLHVATHAHYTAAQTVNMLRQLGVEKLPDTMMIALARQEGVT
jgi:uncharacterized damage-inducible protein DinB